MQNRRYFPFERNSFYPGKLLTARDFEAEQRYMNDKRRLMNRLFGGSGIVAGLGVIMADDASVILQAGCALDASGREIVVPETRVIKLPTVEGYDRLTSNCAYLGISYGETPEEEVYSVMSDENGAPRFNKLAEGYKLTLTDESMAARVPRELDEFVNRVVIYAAEDVEAALLVPACLPRESALRVRFTITRQTPGTGEYAFSCRLGAPGFQTGSGAALDISADKVKLSHGEQRSFDYLLRPEPYLWGGGAVTLAVENFAIRRGDEEFTLNRRMEAVVKPVDQTLDAFYLSACYGRPMDKQLTETFDERLWIAKLLLLRRGSSIIVDRVPKRRASFTPTPTAPSSSSRRAWSLPPTAGCGWTPGCAPPNSGTAAPTTTCPASMGRPPPASFTNPTGPPRRTTPPDGGPPRTRPPRRRRSLPPSKACFPRRGANSSPLCPRRRRRRG